MAGISATDWSWSVLLADFDNDGWKDMHITNGIGRDFINTDFLDFSNTIFASAKTKADQYRLVREKLASLDHINLRNYLYLNHHDYTFTDASASAGIDLPSMSGGAAYVDLDNDGDLDLVVNNIDAEAFVFINNTVQKGQPSPSAHYLAVRLDGDSLNKHGFGTKVWVYNAGNQQLQEENPVRGYFSSVDTKLIFGLGAQTAADSLLVEWPDGRRQRIGHTPADTLLVLAQRNAQWPTRIASPPRRAQPATIISCRIRRSFFRCRRHHRPALPSSRKYLQRLCLPGPAAPKVFAAWSLYYHSRRQQGWAKRFLYRRGL